VQRHDLTCFEAPPAHELRDGGHTSAEALRGAARAAAALGDRGGAFARWQQIVESSPTGGTACYEARIEQVRLPLADGEKSTTTGGDQLEKQLRQTAAAECR
jgi:hypothetical protein